MSDPVNALDGFTAIFLGGISPTVTNYQLKWGLVGWPSETTSDEDGIVWYRRKGKDGHAKILVPNSDVARVLAVELEVSGQKLRVARWQSKALSHRMPAVATNRQKSEMAVKARQERKSEMATKQARHHVKSKVAMKEQAMFVAELLHAQAVPNARRLYSQVASTTEARMKSVETAVHDMKQMLKRLMKQDGV